MIHKDKTITHIYEILMWFNQSCLRDERKSFHYTINNIIDDIIDAAIGFLLLVIIPYHESSCSTGYLLFFFICLSIPYGIYKSIFISYIFLYFSIKIFIFFIEIPFIFSL